MIGISAMGFYLPEQKVSVEDLPIFSELSGVEKLRLKQLEIQTISIADGYNGLDMAYMASLIALRNAGLKPEDISVLLWLPSRAPEYLMSSEVGNILYRLELSKAIGLTVTGLGCCDINGAIETAISFLNAHDHVQHVLIAYGSTPYNYKRYREEITIIGDGGMGIVISKESEHHHILYNKMIIDGKYADLFKIAYKDREEKDYVEECTTNRYKFELSAKSREIFSQMIGQINTKLPINTNMYYFMQNLSIPAFRFNEEALRISLQTSCYDNCMKYGHLGSMDILFNYNIECQNGTLKQNDYAILLNNSPVACWSSILIRV